jgi:hypothetical protein
MASLLGSGTDWLLKRAFKFMLKRNLGCLLRNEARPRAQSHSYFWAMSPQHTCS